MIEDDNERLSRLRASGDISGDEYESLIAGLDDSSHMDDASSLSRNEMSDDRGKLWSVVLIIGIIVLAAWFQISSSADNEQPQINNSDSGGLTELEQIHDFCNALWPLSEVDRDLCINE